MLGPRLARPAAGMLFALLPLVVVAACKKDDSTALKETPPPVAAEKKTAAAGTKRFAVDDAGKLSIWMESGERFSAEVSRLGGVFDVNLDELARSTGEVTADLDTFKSTTPDIDDATQTEHAKNWFEIGDDVPAAQRDDYRIARFTIASIASSSSKSLAEAADKDGARTVTLQAHGTLRVHGRSTPKDAKVELVFRGPPDSPTAISFRTLEPIAASLSEHDVKPRDVTGKFLAGALEKVGKKIDDRPLIRVEGTAKAK